MDPAFYYLEFPFNTMLEKYQILKFLYRIIVFYHKSGPAGSTATG